MKYQRIAALVPAEAADQAAARLGVEGFSVEILDESTIEKPPPGRVGVVVYSELAAGAGALAQVQSILQEANIAAELSASESDEDDWRDKWKAYFKPRHIGRFVIVPSWEQYDPKHGDVVISLDPGRAFGTGGHASTRLCLRAVDEIPSCGRFLDVGCGSGVLSLACALRWPEARGLAIDIDPEAVATTRENAEKNGALGRLVVSGRPLAEAEGEFDVVLANLQADVLVALAPELAKRVAKGGRIVASGILIEQAEEVQRALSEAGLAMEVCRDEEEWTALVAARS